MNSDYEQLQKELKKLDLDEDIQAVNRRFDIAFFTLAAISIITLLTLLIMLL